MCSVLAQGWQMDFGCFKPFYLWTFNGKESHIEKFNSKKRVFALKNQRKAKHGPFRMNLNQNNDQPFIDVRPCDGMLPYASWAELCVLLKCLCSENSTPKHNNQYKNHVRSFVHINELNKLKHSSLDCFAVYFFPIRFVKKSVLCVLQSWK